MMILRSAPPSPYGRKVKLAASVLGLMDQITVDVADTINPDDTIRTQNPLGKIPCLILEDGLALYDSRVIVEYLDHLAGGGRIIPADPKARIAALKMQALGDGICDAALLRVYEGRFRPEDKRSAEWDAHQAGKVERALAHLEANPPGDATDIGTLAVACALGYLDLRFQGAWRADHPTLAGWLDRFAARVPAFEKTRVIP